MKLQIGLLSLLFLIPLFSTAETGVFTIQGMTCGNCVKNIKGTVCKIEGLEDCQVEKGKVTLKTKAGTKLDVKQVEKLVEEAGDYKVSNSSVK